MDLEFAAGKESNVDSKKSILADLEVLSSSKDKSKLVSLDSDIQKWKKLNNV
jgi:hypothetical protein